MEPRPGLAERMAARLAEAHKRARGVGKYETTATSCGCSDHKYRHRECKHMRAYRVLFGEE